MIERVAFGAAAVACAAVLVVVLWAWGLPMTNDGPCHVFAAYVHNHYADPGTAFSTYYDLNSPGSARGFYEVQVALEPLLGWQTAWRVNVLIACELWALAFLAFVVAVEPSRKWIGLLGFPFSLQTVLWLGFMPFIYGSALAMFAMALWFRFAAPSSSSSPSSASASPSSSSPPSPSSPSSPSSNVAGYVGVAVALFLAARAHVAPAAASGALLAFVGVVRATDPRTRLRTLLSLALAGAPALYVAATVAAGASARELSTANVPPPSYQPFVERLLNAGTWFQGGPSWRALFAMALALGGVAWTVARARKKSASRTDIALAAFAFITILACPAIPEDIFHWQMGGTRIAPLAIACGVALLPASPTPTSTTDAPRNVALTAFFAAALYAFASFAWVYSFHVDERASLAPALAGLGKLTPRPRDWTQLPLDLHGHEQPIRGYEPLLHMSQLYVLELGGIARYGQDSMASHHLVLLKPESQVPPTTALPIIEEWAMTATLTGDEHVAAVRRLLAFSSGFSGLVLYGKPPDLDLAAAVGYDADFREGELFIGRFVGCNGKLRIIDAHEPLDVEVGWWPMKTPLLTFSFAPGGATEAPLAAAGCGDVWVKVSGRKHERCQSDAPGLPAKATFVRGAAEENVLVCDVGAAVRDNKDDDVPKGR